MAHPKGRTNNPKGRTKGAINRVSRPIKELVATAVENALAEWPDIWKQLDASQKVQALKALIGFVLAPAQPVQTQTAPQAQEISDVVKGMIEATNGAA